MYSHFIFLVVYYYYYCLFVNCKHLFAFSTFLFFILANSPMHACSTLCSFFFFLLIIFYYYYYVLYLLIFRYLRFWSHVIIIYIFAHACKCLQSSFSMKKIYVWLVPFFSIHICPKLWSPQMLMIYFIIKNCDKMSWNFT